jgi:hypothetical protein
LEQLRLADLSFLPYETLAGVAPFYDQMLEEAESLRPTARERGATIVLSDKPKEIPTERLPVCWNVPRIRRKTEQRETGVDPRVKTVEDRGIFD